MIAVTQENSSCSQQTIEVGKRFDSQQLLQENRLLRWERGHYKNLLDRARAREELLKQQIEQLNARIRYLEKRVYGRKSEKDRAKSKSESYRSSFSDNEPKRSKGHQPGSAGHGRRDYGHLPVQEEIFELDEAVCPHCGRPYQEDTFLGTEDSELIEVEVRAYRRKIRRKKYRKCCRCGDIPGIITAPGPAKLIVRGKPGISVWVTLLLEKYLYQRPINRLLESFKDIEFDMAPGTIGDGLKRLAPLFEPVLQQIVRRNRAERHLHADETRWQVFEFVEGKKSYCWHMWVFVSDSTVVYILDPSRGASVLENHLKAATVLILSVDRFASYKCFAKNRQNVVLAFCWTHVRRDFLDTANGFSELEDWGIGWVDSIGEIFHLNNQRLKHEIGSAKFNRADRSLRKALDAMKQRAESELTETYLHPQRVKRLNSLREHWDGLMVFVVERIDRALSLPEA